MDIKTSNKKIFISVWWWMYWAFYIYTNIKSLCCTLEANIMLYVSYISIWEKQKRPDLGRMIFLGNLSALPIQSWLLPLLFLLHFCNSVYVCSKVIHAYHLKTQIVFSCLLWEAAVSWPWFNFSLLLLPHSLNYLFLSLHLF